MRLERQEVRGSPQEPCPFRPVIFPRLHSSRAVNSRLKRKQVSGVGSLLVFFFSSLFYPKDADIHTGYITTVVVYVRHPLLFFSFFLGSLDSFGFPQEENPELWCNMRRLDVNILVTARYRRMCVGVGADVCFSRVAALATRASHRYFRLVHAAVHPVCAPSRVSS